MNTAIWFLAFVVAIVVMMRFWRLRRAVRFAGRPDIGANLEKLWMADRVGSTLRWDEVIGITLERSANPWGDPQFGSYCDVEWLVRSSDLRALRFADSPANRSLFFRCAARSLLGFDPGQLDKCCEAQVFDPTEGSLSVWSRGH